MTPQRWSAAALAMLAGIALLLQLVLSIQLGIANGRSALYGVWQFVGYFTILSNGLVAWIALRGALTADGGRDLRWRGCAVTAIVLVGVGYHLLLRHVWNPQGAQWLADVLLHYAVPAATLLWRLALPPRHPVAATGPLQWLLWPVAYAVYALARGAATGFYPYPFIDVPTLGMPRVLLNAGGLMLGFVLTGYLLRAGAHWRARAA